MDPIALASLLSAGISAAGGIKNLFSGNSRSSARQNMNMPMNNVNGIQSQELPGGTTAIRMPNFTGQQENILNSLLSQGSQGMGNLPSADFGKVKNAAMSDFYQNTVPGIAERFTGMGSGAQRSSAFGQQLASAGTGLQERLGAMEQGYNMQNRQSEIARLMAMLQMGMQPRSQYQFVPPQQSGWANFIGGAGQALASAAPFAAVWGLNQYMGK